MANDELVLEEENSDHDPFTRVYNSLRDLREGNYPLEDQDRTYLSALLSHINEGLLKNSTVTYAEGTPNVYDLNITIPYTLLNKDGLVYINGQMYSPDGLSINFKLSWFTTKGGGCGVTLEGETITCFRGNQLTIDRSNILTIFSTRNGSLNLETHNNPERSNPHLAEV